MKYSKVRVTLSSKRSLELEIKNPVPGGFYSTLTKEGKEIIIYPLEEDFSLVYIAKAGYINFKLYAGEII